MATNLIWISSYFTYSDSENVPFTIETHRNVRYNHL